MARRHIMESTFRLNLLNPQHAKINEVIKGLNPKIYKSKNQFLIEACEFYIDHYGEQLFKYAAENTRRILPPRIRNMNDVMKEMFLSDGMPEEIAEMMIREVPPEQTLWIISNNRGIDGAVSMLYENELHELAENLESDLYILPSSVHEVLAVSTELTDPEELAQMVAEVNMQKVALEERLSNQVYHYDKDLRKLTLATDTPNKSLDGIVAEPQLVYDAKEKAR